MEKLESLREELKALEKKIDKALADVPTAKKVGEWRKTHHGACLFNYQRTGVYGDTGFGFNAEGEWTEHDEDSLGHWGKDHSPATETEIKTALVKEAERRGFKEGVTYDCISGGRFTGDGPLQYGWNGGDNLSYSGYRGFIYKNGTWATIVKEPEVIKIDRYEVKFHGGSSTPTYTTIDNNVFDKDFWRACETVARHSKACVKIGCSHQFDLPLETIQNILKKI